MRWPSWAELVPLALAAIVEGMWAGALVAVVSGSRGPALMAFAAVIVFVSAVYAHRVAHGERVTLPARAVAVGLALAAAAALAGITRAWHGPQPLWPLLGGVVFTALLVADGASIGRARLTPEAAVRRAVSGFVLLCGVLAAAAIAGTTPAWATVAVIASLVAGALLVANARYLSIRASVPRDQLGPAWAWLLAVAGVIVLVVTAGVLLSEILRIDVILWIASIASGVVHYVLQVAGFVIGWIGAGVIRGGTWLLAQFHIGDAQPQQAWSPRAFPTVLPQRKGPDLGLWATIRVIATVAAIAAAVAAAVALPLALVALALRRLRGGIPEQVVEEREAIASVRSLVGDAAARLGRRLRRVMPRRRPAPTTPAEVVRQRYAELERQLAGAGLKRAPGATVRVFLREIATARPSTPDDASSQIAGIYELARYSGQSIDASIAGRFEILAAAFRASATTA